MERKEYLTSNLPAVRNTLVLFLMFLGNKETKKKIKMAITKVENFLT